MLKDFNLVVSTYRGRENDCISELWYFLKEMGDSKIDASTTGLPGLVVARTCLDPLEVVEKVRREVEEHPWSFRFILKLVPVQKIVEASLENIRNASLELANELIGVDETYRILVRKRLTDLSTRDLIDAIAPMIERKVRLDNPDKVLLIEIIGELAGISVIRPDQIVSIQKIRRKSRLGS